MQQDNIKDFAIAAFRYRGHLNDTDILSLEEVYIKFDKFFSERSFMEQNCRENIGVMGAASAWKINY